MSETTNTAQNSNGPFVVVGLGELLWDMLPAGKQLGGAPTNFSHHIRVLGDKAMIASRIGNDRLGEKILAKLAQLNLETKYIQIDKEHVTSTVDVTLDAGQPTYTIHEGVAWDFFQWNDSWRELAKGADAVCFGSLAQRSSISRATMRAFMQHLPANAVKVFDVNLRQSFFSPMVISDSLALANVVKLNDEELPQVVQMLELTAAGDSLEEMAQSLLRSFELDLVCVTCGSKGCLMVSPEEVVHQSGQAVEVADTVGAGDAFTAAMVHHYLRRRPLSRIAEAANQLGGWVASQAGGTPVPPPALQEQLTKP